jgi:hypothetical protein
MNISALRTSLLVVLTVALCPFALAFLRRAGMTPVASTLVLATATAVLCGFAVGMGVGTKPMAAMLIGGLMWLGVAAAASLDWFTRLRLG